MHANVVVAGPCPSVVPNAAAMGPIASVVAGLVSTIVAIVYGLMGPTNEETIVTQAPVVANVCLAGRLAGTETMAGPTKGQRGRVLTRSREERTSRTAFMAGL